MGKVEPPASCYAVVNVARVSVYPCPVFLSGAESFREANDSAESKDLVFARIQHRQYKESSRIIGGIVGIPFAFVLVLSNTVWSTTASARQTLYNSLLNLYASFIDKLRLTDKRHARKKLISGVRFLTRKVIMQMNDPKEWEELYAAAVLETDSTKVESRINLAQNALRERWQALHKMPLARDRERQRVEDAIRTLNLIRETELRPAA